MTLFVTVFLLVFGVFVLPSLLVFVTLRIFRIGRKYTPKTASDLDSRRRRTRLEHRRIQDEANDAAAQRIRDIA
jgi:hypothetical protein